MSNTHDLADDTLTITVTLRGPLARFAARQLESGRFPDAPALLETAVQQMGDDDEELKALRALIIEGEQSGYDEEPFDLEGFLARQRDARA